MFEQILKELKYQTKLLETISMNTEVKPQNNDMKNAMKNNMALLQKQMLSHPAFSANPEMKKMMDNIINIIPKGEGG